MLGFSSTKPKAGGFVCRMVLLQWLPFGNFGKLRENELLYLWDEDAFLWLKLTAALEVKAHLGIRYILQFNSNVLNHQYNQQYYFWTIQFEQRAVMLRPSGFLSFCSLEIMENGVLIPCRQSISLKMLCKTGRTLHFHLKSVFILKM